MQVELFGAIKLDFNAGYESDLIFQCLRIRMIEEKIIELYPSDLIQSPVHLSIGQEAVAVGFCDQLIESDWVFINYRGHAFYIARGGDLRAFFAELMGRRTGISKGKAGSMHLAEPSKGVIGASAVVASTISHAVGAAVAAKIKGEKGQVFVANFGDGATEQGVFHESLNFASLHNVPVVFLCEDNKLAVHTGSNIRQSYAMKPLVEAYGIKYVEMSEGYDPKKVSEMAAKVIGYARTECRPVFFKVETCRYREHVGPNEDFDAGYRSRQSLEEWKSRDPIHAKRVQLKKYEVTIKTEIEDAVNFALASPFPTEEDLLSDVI